MQKGEPRTSTYRPRYGAGGTRFRQSCDQLRCYLCNETGHFKRNCPLNYQEPARRVGDGWLPQQHSTTPPPPPSITVNAILQVNRSLLNKSVNFLLDSGATVSIIRFDVLRETIVPNYNHRESVRSITKHSKCCPGTNP